MVSYGVAGSSPVIQNKIGEWQSGQLHLAVDQASKDFVGSNPTSPTKYLDALYNVVSY